MSKNYIVFIEQPYTVQISRVMAATTKGYAICDWMEWRPNEANKFHIISKSSGKVLDLKIMSKEAFFFLHVVNCYEVEEDYVRIRILFKYLPSGGTLTS